MHIIQKIWSIFITCGPLISLGSVAFTWMTFKRNSPNLDLEIGLSVLTVPDRTDKNFPDKYESEKYRLILEVIISNKSSQPISITDVSINNKFFLTPYQELNNKYSITTANYKHPEFSEADPYATRTISYNATEFLLKPIQNLAPYSSIRGYFIFRGPDELFEETFTLNETYNLDIKTPRKKFVFPFKLQKEFKSILDVNVKHKSQSSDQ